MTHGVATFGGGIHCVSSVCMAMSAVCVCVCVCVWSQCPCRWSHPCTRGPCGTGTHPPPPTPLLLCHLYLSQATQRVEATIKRSAQNAGKGGGGSPVSSRPSSRAATGAAAGKWGDSSRNAGDEFAAFNAFAVGTTGGGDAPAAKAAPRVSYIDRYALWGEDQHQVAADVLLGQFSDLISSFDDIS